MSQWAFFIGIAVAALACPAMMWLGRRGIGPGCAICPPHRRDDSLEELQARHRALSTRIEQLESDRQAEGAVARSRN